MKTLAIACGLVLAAHAWAAPVAGADLTQGQALHAKHCVACHSALFGGADGANAYLRPDHKVKSASALAQRITVCTTMLKLDLFPEDELNIAGYLNSRYYKFQ